MNVKEVEKERGKEMKENFVSLSPPHSVAGRPKPVRGREQSPGHPAQLCRSYRFYRYLSGGSKEKCFESNTRPSN